MTPTDGDKWWLWRRAQYAHAYDALMDEFTACMLDAEDDQERRYVVAHYKRRLAALRAKWGQTG